MLDDLVLGGGYDDFDNLHVGLEGLIWIDGFFPDFETLVIFLFADEDQIITLEEPTYLLIMGEGFNKGVILILWVGKFELKVLMLYL